MIVMCLCVVLSLIQVTGFPIQMPYTDIQSVIDAVYQTGIHSSEFPETEFALAVYIHPYSNNILSVWVYLVSLAQHHWKEKVEKEEIIRWFLRPQAVTTFLLSKVCCLSLCPARCQSQLFIHLQSWVITPTLLSLPILWG